MYDYHCFLLLSCLPLPAPPALPQVQLLSKDFGKHLLEVDDLLQKHSLQEADISVQAERVETLNTAALKFTTIEGKHVFFKTSSLQRVLSCFRIYFICNEYIIERNLRV